MVARGVLIFLVASLLTTPFIVPATSVIACSCAPSDLEARVARSELIILGTVLEILEVETESNSFPTLYDLTVVIDEYLKGEGSDTVIVRESSMLQGEACSAFDPEAVGRPHLLMLTRNKEGLLATSSCAGSGAITDQNRDHMELTSEQIRQIIAGTPLLTATVAPVAREITPTSVPDFLPPSGSASSSEGTNTLLFTTAAIAGLLALGAVAAVGWRGARRA